MWYWQDWHIRLTCLLKATDESMVVPSSLIMSDMGMANHYDVIEWLLWE